MIQFFLLLIEIDDLSIINFEYFISPQSTARMHVHVQHVRNETTGHREFTLLLAEYTNKVHLRVDYLMILVATDHRLRSFLIFGGVQYLLREEILLVFSFRLNYFCEFGNLHLWLSALSWLRLISLILTQEDVHSFGEELFKPFEELKFDPHNCLDLTLNILL